MLIRTAQTKSNLPKYQIHTTKRRVCFCYKEQSVTAVREKVDAYCKQLTDHVRRKCSVVSVKPGEAPTNH